MKSILNPLIEPLARSVEALSLVRSFTTDSSAVDRLQRRDLLNKIYAPFQKLGKDSPEYMELARSGRVWKDYFKPFQVSKADLDFNTKYKNTLDNLTRLKAMFPPNPAKLPDLLKMQFSHRSVAIEGYTLQQGDSRAVYEKLKALHRLYDDPAPPPAVLLPDSPPDQVIMIRNQIIAFRYALHVVMLADTITEEHLSKLHSLLLTDTPEASLVVWSKLQQAGKYRTVPMQAAKFNFTVYPYPAEIPSLMKQLVQFHGDVLSEKTGLHPVLAAAKLSTIFYHIHPFFDGNGRMGRILMAITLLRLGYHPVIYQQISREEYVTAVYQAQQGNPETLHAITLEAMEDFYMCLHDEKDG